jgi:hypothetical protein
MAMVWLSLSEFIERQWERTPPRMKIYSGFANRFYVAMIAMRVVLLVVVVIALAL